MEKNPPTPTATCPNCTAPIQPGISKCPGCGASLAKSDDEKKRLEAEARLLALGREASSGLPVWLKATAAALVIVPLALIFIPDIGAPLMGGKLRYKLKPTSVVRHKGSCVVTVSATAVGVVPTIVDHLEFQADTKLTSLEVDSGGNTTVSRAIERAVVVPVFINAPEIPRENLGAWTNRWVMNSHGGLISTMANTTAQMQSNAQTMRRQHELRTGMAAYRADYGWNAQAQSVQTMPGDPYQNIVDGMKLTDIGAIDRLGWLEYPNGRVRPGHTWKKNIDVSFASKWFRAELYNVPVTFKIESFRRSGAKYVAVISWSSDITPGLKEASALLWPLITDSPATGQYSGKAEVNYADGIVETWNGEYVFTVTPSSLNSGSVVQILGLQGAPGSDAVIMPLEFKATEKITRL